MARRNRFLSKRTLKRSRIRHRFLESLLYNDGRFQLLFEHLQLILVQQVMVFGNIQINEESFKVILESLGITSTFIIDRLFRIFDVRKEKAFGILDFMKSFEMLMNMETGREFHRWAFDLLDYERVGVITRMSLDTLTRSKNKYNLSESQIWAVLRCFDPPIQQLQQFLSPFSSSSPLPSPGAATMRSTNSRGSSRRSTPSSASANKNTRDPFPESSQEANESNDLEKKQEEELEVNEEEKLADAKNKTTKKKKKNNKKQTNDDDDSGGGIENTTTSPKKEDKKKQQNSSTASPSGGGLMTNQLKCCPYIPLTLVEEITISEFFTIIESRADVLLAFTGRFLEKFSSDYANKEIPMRPRRKTSITTSPLPEGKMWDMDTFLLWGDMNEKQAAFLKKQQTAANEANALLLAASSKKKKKTSEKQK